MNSNRYKFIDEKREHLHTLDSKSLLGTTTIINETLNKPLAFWASGMCAEKFGWINPKKHNAQEVFMAAEHGLNVLGQFFSTPLEGLSKYDTNRYIKFLDEAYRAHNVKKESRAVEGTNLHAEAESYIKCKMETGESFLPSPLLTPFIMWCEKNVKHFLFSEIHCYSERLWVGGKTDFGYESMDGEYVLADIKSRDKVYFSDFVQCGGYDIQIQENQGLNKNGNIIFDFPIDLGEILQHRFNAHAIFPLGENFKEPVISRETEKNRQAFENCVSLYKLKKEFENDLS